MDLFTEFLELFKSRGLSSHGRFYSIYRGIVVDNADPEFRARLKIKCPAVFKNETFDGWAFPRGMAAGKKWGFYAIPSVGDQIWVSFEEGDPSFPIWEYGTWTDAHPVPETAKIKTQDNFVFQTPKGQRIEFNDSTDKITITDKTGNVLELSSRGFSMKKGSVTAASLFEELFDLFASTTTATIIGPQPFINVALYSLLKTKFQNFFY